MSVPTDASASKAPSQASLQASPLTSPPGSPRSQSADGDTFASFEALPPLADARGQHHVISAAKTASCGCCFFKYGVPVALASGIALGLMYKTDVLSVLSGYMNRGGNP